ncbi:MAG: PQQ-dependent sugar dehydrogenase [Deltaproteobacteria bacterium]|nr:PQQ-dependent sugar dehydrogenase [Deltaproteobacteria bacterium]
MGEQALRKFLGALLAFTLAGGLPGCYKMRSSAGGGQTEFNRPRIVNSNDIAVPDGYRIESVARELTFPTGIAFDGRGRAYVVEAGYSHGEVWTTPRLLRIENDGTTSIVAEGNKNGPWTGVTFYKGNFYVAEGGELDGGRVLKITPDGDISPLVDGLPSKGDHHTNGPAIGPDGMLYFGVGTATNSGVVGEDNFRLGWAKRYPGFHDIPCRDVKLKGINYETKDFIDPASKEKVGTGAFSPFGKKTEPDEVIKGSVPCSGAVMRVPVEGGEPELVAWGFRNPFGLAFSPEGKLFATDNSYDERGSRAVFGAGDLLWEVKEGNWYGWPDFHGEHPLNEHDHYKPARKEKPELIFSEPPGKPPRPAAIFAAHSSSSGFDFSRDRGFGLKGHAFVAQFGDEAPTTGKVLAPVGFKVVRVNVKTGDVEEFAVNKGKTNGPASWLKKGGFERPVAARFNPDGTALYIVDFGVLLHDEEGAKPRTATGVVWRITKKEPGR